MLPVPSVSTDPMLAKLPGLIRVPLAMLLLALNILLHVLPLFAFTLVKVIVPVRGVRLACDFLLALARRPVRE